MAVARKSLVRRIDWPIWLLGLAVIISLVAFGLYYYNDRYVHPDQTVLERQAQQLEEMVKKNPQNADLRVNVAAYYLQAGLVDQAIQQSNEGLKIQPDNQGAFLVLGEAYNQKGDLDNAIKNYTRFLDLNKGNSLAGIDTRIEGAYYDLGRIYDRQGKLKEANDSLHKAIAIDNTDADALYALGVVYQEQKDNANAVKEFEEALRFDPTYGPPYQGLVVSYTALDRPTDAAYAQAMVTFTEGKYGDAATQLEAVLKQSPGLTKAYFGLGLAYEKLGRLDQSASALEKYAEAYPNDIGGQDALARVAKEKQP
jgi:tetratricopeptide (TPR) repeat protein